MRTGFLAVDKPVGVRSAAVVAAAKRTLGKGAKVGHAGTLDSTASGLIVLLLGGATRLSSIVMSMIKHYVAVVRLGSETTTCDADGDLLESRELGAASDDLIDTTLASYLGWREQRPPQISAIHIGGRRSHELYRGGEEPDLRPRPVFIESIARASHLTDSGEFKLDVVCGKGTYVRSLARDIGRDLGCLAHLASLRRTSVGCFSLDDAVPFDLLDSSESIEGRILPLEHISSSIPIYDASEELADKLMNGTSIPLAMLARRTVGAGAPIGTIGVSHAHGLSICTMTVDDGAAFAVPVTNVRATPEDLR